MNVSDTKNGVRKAVVVGAGPVGCLVAMSLAKMGWEVDVYEQRPGKPRRFRFFGTLHKLRVRPAPDLRLPSSKAAVQQRSINLAVSSRGIAALRAVDPAIGQRFLQTAIPMRGRMIHDVNGKQQSQLYDKDGQVRPRLVPHERTNVAWDLSFRPHIFPLSK